MSLFNAGPRNHQDPTVASIGGGGFVLLGEGQDLVQYYSILGHLVVNVEIPFINPCVGNLVLNNDELQDPY
jgi:hypothetical protein